MGMTSRSTTLLTILVFLLQKDRLVDGARLKRDAFAADLVKPLFDALKPNNIVPTEEDVTASDAQNSTADALYCSLCMFLAEFLKVEVRDNGNIENLAVSVCEENYGTTEQCQGFVNAQLISLFHVLNTTEDLRTENLCGSLTNCLSSAEVTWNVKFPDNELPRLPKKTRQERQSNQGLKIIQLTDLHIDPDYEGETIGECFLNICCKARKTRPENATSAKFRTLGPWGDYYACGVPWKVLRKLMCDHINKTHSDADLIIWTGDIPGHGSWFQSKERNLETTRKAVELAQECLPSIPVIPAVGNHESYPVNDFKPGMANFWLYEQLTQMWSKWLPPDVLQQAKKGGFYSIPIRNGLRAIVLNTNYCYKYNWWNHVNITDPEGQLQWFSEELEKAAATNENVYIISHISPGSDACLPTWGHHYFQLLDKYSDTILAQFYGHEHTDTFQVFYAETDDSRLRRPIGVAFIGPSITPLNGLNPAYRVYSTARNSDAIADVQTYFFDLNEANAKNSTEGPEWKLLYSTKEDFGFRPTSFLDWDYAVRKLHDDDELFQRFYTFSKRNSSALPRCGKTCKRDALCSMEALDKTGLSKCKAKETAEAELQNLPRDDGGKFDAVVDFDNY